METAIVLIPGRVRFRPPWGIAPASEDRMTRYRKIHSKIWTDQKFRAASDDCRIVFFQLITSIWTVSPMRSMR